uniref:Collagen alpha-1(XIV) chain n=1 Tax=Magallana gigas TaxID=29159 RepID=K1PQ87_MAGGI
MARILWVIAALSLVSLTHSITNDVVYIIDTSGSLSQTNLNYSIDFLYDVTEFLTIGSSDIKISIVTFSNVSIVQHDFNSLSDKAAVLTALESLKSITTAGGTKTYEALNETNTLFTSASSGRRTGVNQTVVVLTDGKSDNLLNTRSAAETLHMQGIEVFSVGVGSEVVDDKTELYAIASDPDSYYQHDIENFIHLCNVVPTLALKLASSTPIIAVGAAASLLLLSSIPGGYFMYKAALRRKIRQEEKEEEVQDAIQPYENSAPKHLGPGKPAWQA